VRGSTAAPAQSEIIDIVEVEPAVNRLIENRQAHAPFLSPPVPEVFSAQLRNMLATLKTPAW
jgi:hypothetical protein